MTNDILPTAVGLATVMFFLEFYFHDQVPLPGNMRAEEAVAYALLPLLLCAAVSSIIAGQVRLARGASCGCDLPNDIGPSI
jgi:hypothetical protein